MEYGKVDRVSSRLRRILIALGEVSATIMFLHFVVFVAVTIVPVDPARAFLGPNASERDVAEYREGMGLNRPLPVQYLASVRRLMHGDLGVSIFHQRPATDVLARLAPLTLLRWLIAAAIGTAAGVGVGWLAIAMDLRRIWWLLVSLQAVPAFCLMVLLLWLPTLVFGATPLGHPLVFELLGVCGSALFPMAAVAIYIMEFENQEPTGTTFVDFLRMLRLPRKVIASAIVRSLAPQLVSVALNTLVAVLSGVSFAEIVFGLPGFGSAFFQACAQADLPVVAGGTLLLAGFLLAAQRLGEAMAPGRLDGC